LAAPASLQLFGWWDLRVREQSVTLGRREQRLIALLALTGRRARTQIAGILWPDSTESRAMVSLRAAVWHVRQAAQGLLAAEQSTLALAPHVTIDVDRLVDRATTVIDSRCWEFTESLASLEGKDLLPGWYDDWVLFERERIEHVRFRALESMSQECLQTGDPNGSALAARAALQIEPLHEGANLLLIRACLASGSTVEAVRHFGSYCRRLELDLGIRPSPQVRDLIQPLLIPHQRQGMNRRRH
jgi:DNA-binding SARP family transcriptional activator